MKYNNNFTTKQLILYNHKALNKNEIDVPTWWNFLETINDPELIKTILGDIYKAEKRLKDIKNSFYYKTKIRKYCECKNLLFFA